MFNFSIRHLFKPKHKEEIPPCHWYTNARGVRVNTGLETKMWIQDEDGNLIQNEAYEEPPVTAESISQYGR